MANFNTHLTVATSISGTLALGLLVTELATAKTVFFYWLLGTVGGILPDIDAPNSIPARLLFTVSGIVLASLLVASQLNQFFWIELMVLWIVTFIGCRYGLLKLFARLTNHRGQFHSIFAALLFGLSITVIAYQDLAVRARVAWLAGGFVIMGYLIHLLLDEIYSVDITQQRLKKSFGSAFKLADTRHKLSTLLLILANIVLLLWTPGLDKMSHQVYLSLVQLLKSGLGH
jgi:uncharacterized membrane protein